MTNRERLNAILSYKNYDRMPVVHFGFWPETLQKWHKEGYLTSEEVIGWKDGSPADKTIGEKLGFDFNWFDCYTPETNLLPKFERKILDEFPDGSQKVLSSLGVILLEKPGISSIPAEIDHLLKTRNDWDKYYRNKLLYSEKRILNSFVNTDTESMPFLDGGLEYLRDNGRDRPIGLHCGSMLGRIRNYIGVDGLSYMLMDDEVLLDEIIQSMSEMCYLCVEKILSYGIKFDFAHFWEDISCNSGPLVMPSMFEKKIGPCYKRITELLNNNGIDITSVDSDGDISVLVPIWLNNGVNTMFPIEVGTWGGSIKPLREKYGKKLRGVGGMNKMVFSFDFNAIDKEIERLKPLVELGGYIPCPDHRIPPESKWDNVKYYCEKVKRVFGK